MKLIFKIEGMCCVSEVTALKRVLGPLVNGREDLISFDLINEKVTVEVEGDSPSEKQIIKAIQETGMKGIPWKDHVKKTGQKEGFFQRFGRFISTTLSGVGLVAGFIYHAATDSVSAAFAGEDASSKSEYPITSVVLYAGAIVAGAVLIVPKAVRAIRQLRPNTELLMTTAVVGAVAMEQWFEATAVVFLFSASVLLEKWNLTRARKAIRGLMDLAPPTARVVESASADDLLTAEADVVVEMKEFKEGRADDELIREKAVEDIPVGAIIIVNPGEKIPMDSVLISETAEVNQAPVTGESVPVHKKPGDELFAGTINGDHAIRCRVTKLASDSTLAHIVRLIEEAQSRRSQSEQVSEKFARYYTPTMMFLAGVVAVVLPLALGEPFEPWVYQALTLLVISCPCALVISTPLTITAGLGAAARAGVLIKGGVHLEAPAHIKAFAMDKTGTLTSGEPRVREVVALQGYSKQTILKLAALLETHSDHPLARAIRREAATAGVTSHEKVEQFQVTKGKGAEGYIKGKLFWLGSPRFLREKTSGAVEPAELKRLEEEGRSIVAVGCGDQVYGLISIADSVRPEAKAMARALKQVGVQKVVMLTGDHKGTAKAIAEAVGIDDYRAELLPADKVSAVEGLVREYKQVAMVGDGINDAPAMAISGLGIAMGAAGSDAAIETADIALMSDNLEKLPWLVRHSRRTATIIKQNITFSLVVKGVFSGLAFAKKANLWMAIAADMGSSFIVIFNGLRLLNDEATCQPSRGLVAVPVVDSDRIRSEELLFLTSPDSVELLKEEERLYGSPLSPVGRGEGSQTEEEKKALIVVETVPGGSGVRIHHYGPASPSGVVEEKDKETPSSPSPKSPTSPKSCCSEGGCKSKSKEVQVQEEPKKGKKKAHGHGGHGHAHGEHGHSHGGGHGHAHGEHAHAHGPSTSPR